MARTAALVGVAALAGIGIYAALPDDEPRYLGDMPSMMEQSEAVASPAQPEPPDPPAPVAPRVDPPSPVGVEAPPAVGGAHSERAPDPVTDARRGYPGGGATGGGTDSPAGGLLGFLDGLPLDGALLCIGVDEITRPDGSIVDCLTGVITPPVEIPDPPDPCLVLPLPVECPVALPE